MDKNDIRIALDKILNAPTLANKEVMKGLLKYLYESSEKGHLLKEIDIAIDFFKRDKQFVPGDDTIVRVNIHKLRTLLDAYYRNEGRKDTLILEIPKGSYVLKLVNKGQNVNSRNKWTIKVIYSLLFLSLSANLFFILRNSLIKPGADNPVWSDYISKGKPVNIILGDPFFFRVNDSLPETVIVRDITINSTEEMMKAGKNLFQGEIQKIKPLNYPYFSTNNIRPLPDIIETFARANTDIRLQALSETNTDDIKRTNCIFLANINSFRHISKFLEQTSIRVKTNPRQIIVDKGADSFVFSVPEFIHGYYTDYAFMVKIPGPENNLLTIMGDFHGSGINGLTDFITREPSLSAFEKKIKQDYGSFPQYFEMVVKVISYNYADFKTEVIYFKPVIGNK